MLSPLGSLQLLSIALAGWLNRQQQAIIEYLIEENRVLKAQLEGKRLRLSDDQRRRLAVKGKAVGRRVLGEIASLVTPDTILAWHRRLVAQKWTYPRKGPGRPPVGQEVIELVLRMASENPGWGYDRIQGAVSNLGHEVCASTVRNILKRHGIEPAPERERRTTWSTFLKAHWEVLAAADFFTTEVWTPRGLITYYLLFTIRLATRRVCIAGITACPTDAFMIQAARQLTDEFDGALRDCRFLIMDRDTKFTKQFKTLSKREGITPVLCPPRAPNCNAIAERFVRSIRAECLERMIFCGVRSRRYAVSHYTAHYDGERNHQGVGNQLLAPVIPIAHPKGHVKRRPRLGGTLNFYYREAA